ncbi:MAG TPA: hypothetical protein VGS59_14260 [Candidatus Acidoferrales bacterium]|nr:hypothetical protein [Candidatus Acidoferrales bacterium]
MRIARSVLLVFLFVLVLRVLNAQPAPAPRDAHAVALLQRSLSALVGTNTLNDATLTGYANYIAGSDEETGSVTLKATAIGQGRADLSLSNGKRSEVIDTSQATPVGSWCGADGVWHPMVAHNLYTDPSWFSPAFLISRARSNVNYAISPLDAETQNGVAVEHVRIYFQSDGSLDPPTLVQGLSQIDIYLNASTLLPVSIAFNTHADNNALLNIPIQVTFSNYQLVQGISVPYHVQKYVQNGLALDVTVTGVQFNSGLSTSDFQVQ